MNHAKCLLFLLELLGRRPANQRWGQFVWNEAVKCHPWVDELRNTDLDPFYDDSIVPAFLERVFSDPRC